MLENPPSCFTIVRPRKSSTVLPSVFNLPCSCEHQIHSSLCVAAFIHLATKLLINQGSKTVDTNNRR
jgi:hypothetical protein